MFKLSSLINISSIKNYKTSDDNVKLRKLQKLP